MVSIRLLDEMEYLGCPWEHSVVKKWQEGTEYANMFSDCYTDRLKPIQAELDRVLYEVWGEGNELMLNCDSKVGRAELQAGIKRTEERAGLIGASRKLMSEELMALVRVCGLPVRVRYNHGKYESAVVGGRVGKSITTAMVSGVPNVVSALADIGNAEVRGYVGLRKSKAESRYTKTEIGMEISSKKPNWNRVQFIADELIICGEKKIATREEEVRTLKRLGFKTPMMIHLGKIREAEDKWEKKISNTVKAGYKKYGIICEGVEILGIRRLKVPREGTPEAIIMNCGVSWETRKVTGKISARRFSHDNGQIRVQLDIEEDGGGKTSVILRDAALDIERSTLSIGSRIDIDTAFGYAIW